MKEYDLEPLRRIVCMQNKRLAKLGLVISTEGNVSERSGRRMAIKPSGVFYDKLSPAKIPVMDITTRELVKEVVNVESLFPSVDTPIHLELYRRFPEIGGVVHTHSLYASIFAQAGEPIPCYGTTHADAFYGDVPVTRMLTEEEYCTDYERNVGVTIAEVINPKFMPVALVYGHGPFAVGASAEEAVTNALILEKVAQLAWFSRTRNSRRLPQWMIDKHFYRKHGASASYGQKGK